MKRIFKVLVFIVLLSAVVGGVILVQKNQEMRKGAAGNFPNQPRPSIRPPQKAKTPTQRLPQKAKTPTRRYVAPRVSRYKAI